MPKIAVVKWLLEFFAILRLLLLRRKSSVVTLGSGAIARCVCVCVCVCVCEQFDQKSGERKKNLDNDQLHLGTATTGDSVPTQKSLTSSKSAMGTWEQCVKSVQN